MLLDEQRRLSLVLPSGAKYSGIAQRIYLGRRGDQLRYIKAQGLNKPLDQAVSEAQAIASALGIEATDVTEWYKRTKQNEGGALSFKRQYDSDAANFGVKILRSFDNQHPWFVAVEFHFPVDERSDVSIPSE